MRFNIYEHTIINDHHVDHWPDWSTSPGEVSSAGAQGIAQIMPRTAAHWGVNPWDPYQALSAAAQHLSEYYTQFGNSWSNALAAYNGGASQSGMAGAYAGGYPQKVLGIAQSLGADVSTAISGGAPIGAPGDTSGAGNVQISPVVLAGAVAALVVAALVGVFL